MCYQLSDLWKHRCKSRGAKQPQPPRQFLDPHKFQNGQNSHFKQVDILKKGVHFYFDMKMLLALKQNTLLRLCEEGNLKSIHRAFPRSKRIDEFAA